MINKTLFVWAVISVTLFIAFVYYIQKQRAVVHVNEPTKPQPFTPNMLVGGDIKLTDTKGQTFSLCEHRSPFYIVYFGYTFCPDICPTALNTITQALKFLPAEVFQPLFITVDPERDTKSTLKTFMQDFHPTFIALTGSALSIKKAMHTFRVYAAKAPSEEDGSYLVDHSSLVYVTDKQGKLLTQFSHDAPLKKVISLLERVYNEVR